MLSSVDILFSNDRTRGISKLTHEVFFQLPKCYNTEVLENRKCLKIFHSEGHQELSLRHADYYKRQAKQAGQACRLVLESGCYLALADG